MMDFQHFITSLHLYQDHIAVIHSPQHRTNAEFKHFYILLYRHSSHHQKETRIILFVALG